MMSRGHRRVVFVFLAFGCFLAAPADPARADETSKSMSGGHAMRASRDGHVLLLPTAMKWVAGPQSLPPGSMVAVLEGSPAATGPFAMRLLMPAGYRIPAHTHPADERVTVISGTLHLGMGDKLNPNGGTALPAGSYAVMPKGAAHFAWTDDETIVQLNGIGPWGIDYLDPATDPRKAKN